MQFVSIIIPFVNWFVISFFGRKIGKSGVIFFTIFNMVMLILVNLYCCYLAVVINTAYYINCGAWIKAGLFVVYWEFVFDLLSSLMLLMVGIISALVHVYSFSYMKNDPHFNRFISYLSLFSFFMFILISANNLIIFFFGWEGVGICSYLIINFWFTRIQANKAALKALLMNRIGDIGFIIGISLVFFCYKTVDFSVLEAVAGTAVSYGVRTVNCFGIVHLTLIDVICFFFFIGVMGKSAQIGLHTWLPAAMEGPTPVSALIHAATMVTAGVFLMIRCSFFFDISPTVMAFVQIIGAFTALSAALTAIFIYDIKKIIAYSTCSQLGYMILACGLHQYTIGFFHLINHAFFKALLFLTAGAIIHSFNNEQDIRKIAGVSYTAPLLHSALLIGSWAIMGLPFFSGYYSKDAIIELVYIYGKKTVLNSEFSINYLYLLILIATFCTGVYSVRLYYYLFIREGAFLKDIKKIEQPFFINLVIVILMLGSIFSGYCISDLFSLSNATFENIKYRPWVQYAVRSDNYDRLRFTSDFEHYFKTKAMGEEAQAEEFVTAPVWMQKRLGWGPKTLVERDFVGYSDKHHDEMPVLPYGGNSDHHVRIAIEDESSPRYMRAYTSTTLVDPAAPFSCYFNSLKGMKNIVDYHPKKLPRKDWEHMNRIINAYINDPSVGRYLKGVKLAPNGMPYQRKWNDKKDIESNQLWLVDETDPILLNHFNETGEIYENREDRTFHYADGTATIGWAVEGMLPVAIPELSRVPFYKDKTRDPEYDSMFLIGKVGKLPVLGINTNSKLGGKASDEELGAYGRGICPYWKEENAFDPNLYDAQVEFLPWYIKLAPLFCNLLSMFGGLFFIYLYQLGIIPKYYQLILASLDDRYKENILIKQYFSRLALRLLDMYFKTVKKFIRIVQKNYLFNELYSYFSLWSLQRIFYDMVANFDKGLLLYAGPKGAFWLYMKLSKKFIKFFNMGWKYHLFILYNTFIIFTLIIFFMV